MAKVKESVFQRRCIEHWAASGFVVIKTKPGSASAPKGFPDTIVFAPQGVVYAAEFKSKGGKLSAIQKYWKKKLEDLGHTFLVMVAGE